MPVYIYSAYDGSGNKISGELRADNLSAAKSELLGKKLTPVDLKEKNEKSSSQALFKQTVSLGDAEFLTSELALLLNSGLRIDKALSILARNKAKGAVSELLNDILQAVKRGEALSAAMAKHPSVFDSLYINLVQLGEASGKLSEVFSKLAEDLKFKRELRRNVIQALTYPAVILSVCVLCILFIFNYIVPQMSGLFDSMSELPVYTEVLLNVSQWVRDYQIWAGIAIVAGITGLVYASKRPELLQKLDRTLLSVPLIGAAVLMVERIRFNSAVAMMLQAGISIDKAIELAASSTKNTIVSKGLQAIKDAVKKGEQLSSSLAQSPIYPDFYISLLEVGEESGQLVPVFEEIAGRSRDEFRSWTTKLTSLLEPLLILIMGGIVGTVVVVMLLSIVSVNELGV